MTLAGGSPPSLGATRLIAVRVLQVLGGVGEINQRGLAVEVEASESSLSRVLGKLAKMGGDAGPRGAGGTACEARACWCFIFKF